MATVLPALPAQEKEPLQVRVNKALKLARPALLTHLGTAPQSGHLALLCLAAAHDSVSPTQQTFAAAIRRLSGTKLDRTYELAIRLMLMTHLSSYPDRRKAVVKDAKRLLRNQTPRGGFSYSEGKGRWDLSNSQYAALGLRAAASLGVDIPKSRWKRLARHAITAQDNEGGFTYSSSRAGSRGQGYSSMTAAGIAVLQICSQHLDAKTVADLELPRRIEHAWDWMAEHKADIGNERARHCLYFHYGLERACILSDVIEIDGKDWYAAGAEMLIGNQLTGGGWFSNDIGGGKSGRGEGNPISTAFAILFLRRKFKKLLGPITPGGGIRVAQLGPQATADEIEEAVDAEVRRGKRVVPDLLKSLHSTIETRRKAALRAMIRITGKDFRYNPHLPPKRNAEALKRAELWWLKHRTGG
jgi:hypothetical protein